MMIQLLLFCWVITGYIYAIPPEQEIINPKKQTLLRVISGTDFPEQEQAFVQARHEKARMHINELLSDPEQELLTLEETPVIGIVASGGGNRAMIASLGFIQGLEECNLLKTATYMAALSGSTWFLAPWIIKNKSLADFSAQLEKNVLEAFEHKHFSYPHIIKALFETEKKHHHKPTLCDAWGTAIGSYVFKEEKDDNTTIPGSSYTLPSLITNLSSELHPFPLFTAIFSKSHPYEWMEFSPFAISSSYVDATIPSEALGKHFLKGEVLLDHQRLLLTYLLGLFGSAYAADFGIALSTVLEMTRNNLNPQAVIAFDKTFGYLRSASTTIAQKSYNFASSYAPQNMLRWVQQKVWGPQSSKQPEVMEKELSQSMSTPQESYRMSPPVIPNFTRGLAPEHLKDDYYYTLVDAGLAFNLPFPPLLRRKVDLYIVCDASSNTALTDQENNALIGAQRYAKRKEYPFPEVDLSSIDLSPIEKLIQVCYDPNDPAKPIIVYIPNTIDFVTTKFSYTSGEFRQLRQNMADVVKNGKDIILQAIKNAINNKRRLKNQKASELDKKETSQQE